MCFFTLHLQVKIHGFHMPLQVSGAAESQVHGVIYPCTCKSDKCVKGHLDIFFLRVTSWLPLQHVASKELQQVSDAADSQRQSSLQVSGTADSQRHNLT